MMIGQGSCYVREGDRGLACGHRDDGARNLAGGRWRLAAPPVTEGADYDKHDRVSSLQARHFL